MNTGETIALIKAFGNGGGGGGLPHVTSADNGKVLGVVDGAWAADENVFIVTFTYSGGYKADKTFAEISDAMSANKRIIGVYGTSNIYGCSKSSSGFVFALITGKAAVSILVVGSNNVVQQDQCATVETVLNSENGYELVSSSGKWVKQAKKFIITLTPTSPDYSGTMDKTVAEINAAYEAGQEIVFKFQTSATAYIEVPVQLVGHDTTLTYPSFETSVVQHVGNVQVFAYTGVTEDGTKQTYSTKIYALTPAS